MRNKLLAIACAVGFALIQIQLRCGQADEPQSRGAVVTPPGISRVVADAPLFGSGTSYSHLVAATFGAGNSGVVGASGGGTTNFLRADGTWAAPAGGTPTSRLINTTSPLAGGGDLTADRTLSISTNGISNSLFRQGVGTSVVGVSGGSTANVADISASANNQILARLADSLSWSDFAALAAQLSTRGHYGDCGDGALTFDGSSTVTLGVDGATLVPSSSIYTLTRDIYASTVSISNGVIIEGKGFFIFACTSITVPSGTATYRCNGGAGGNGTTLAGGSAGTQAISSGGGRYATASAAAGAGALTSGGAGTAASLPNPNKTTTHGQSPNAGGSGGAGFSGGGGAGGGTNINGATSGSWRTWASIITGTTSGQTAHFNLTGGGGGGGTGGASQGGGGGGAGAGYVGVFTPLLVGPGVLALQAKGGAGGTGAAGTDAGGGGGGGGGFIIYDIMSGTATLTVDASGGTGGAKGGAAGSFDGETGGNGQTIILN